MSADQPQVDPDRLTELRLIEQSIRHSLDISESRVKTIDAECASKLKEIESAKKSIEDRLHILGFRFSLGLFAVLALLFFFLLKGLEPIVKSEVERRTTHELDDFDFASEIQRATDVALSKRLSPEVIASKVDDEMIRKAALNAVESPDFQTVVGSMVENAAQAAVKSSVEQYIAREVNIQTIVSNQLRNYRQRLEETNVGTPIEANSRMELVRGIANAIKQREALGLDLATTEVLPFSDVFRVRLTIYTDATAPENKRLRIWSLALRDVAASTDEKRSKVKEYLGLKSTLNIVELRPTEADDGRRYELGEYRNLDAAYFSDYNSIASALAEDTVAFVEACFGDITFPTTWRVQGVN